MAKNWGVSSKSINVFPSRVLKERMDGKKLVRGKSFYTNVNIRPLVSPTGNMRAKKIALGAACIPEKCRNSLVRFDFPFQPAFFRFFAIFLWKSGKKCCLSAYNEVYATQQEKSKTPLREG